MSKVVQFNINMKKTLVLGATPNPERYAYLATRRLTHYGHEVVPVGIRKGEIGDLQILEGKPEVEDIDTVTLYIGPDRQSEYYDYIFSLQPKRIIFNPGTENPELMRLAAEHGIETVEGCTLVMLSIGGY
jgi:predicted CoA-binding protein